MRIRTRHPRLTAAACRIYGLTLWVYPAEFRRAFGHELVVTFRNRFEDVLNGGGIWGWLTFALHIAVDSVRAYGTLLAAGDERDSISLLGLSDGDAAHGCIDRKAIDVPLVFAVAGFAMAVVGWYTFFITFPSYPA